MLKSYLPGPQNVAVFGDRVFREAIIKMRSLGWVLMQYGWCPNKKRTSGYFYLWREDQETQGWSFQGAQQVKDLLWCRFDPWPAGHRRGKKKKKGHREKMGISKPRRET